MMETKIEVLTSQAQKRYKTYNNDKPSAAAKKMKKHIAHIASDNEKLRTSKKGLGSSDFAKFKNIMHAYYEAELAAVDMPGKEKRDKLKNAKQTKSAALKDWAASETQQEDESPDI